MCSEYSVQEMRQNTKPGSLGIEDFSGASGGLLAMSTRTQSAVCSALQDTGYDGQRAAFLSAGSPAIRLDLASQVPEAAVDFLVAHVPSCCSEAAYKDARWHSVAGREVARLARDHHTCQCALPAWSSARAGRSWSSDSSTYVLVLTSIVS